MATKVQVNPLIDIRNATFATNYEQGIYRRLYGWQQHGEVKAQGPLPDSFLVENLKMCAQVQHFDGHHEEQLQKEIGYFIGMLHGGILSPATGQLRPEVITLVTFTNQDTARGYRVGREYFCHEAETQACRYTDGGLIERLSESVIEMVDWKDTDATWNYTIGCILGELSGQLFPETQQERQEWEEECQKVLT
jgi:hypothetical protein